MSEEVMEKKVSFHLVTKMEGYLADMATAQRRTQEHVGAITGSFTRMGAGINSILNLTGTLGGILAGGAMFGDIINTTNAVTGEVSRLSKGLGITAQEASVLRVALDDAFLSADDMMSGAMKLTRQLLTNEGAFKNLGVATRDVNGNYRDIVSIMTDVNDKLRAMKEGTDQNVAGQAIYGRGWSELRGLLRLTSGSLVEAKERAEELGIMIGPEQVAASKKFKLAMKDLEDVSESFKVQIGNNMIDPLTEVAVAFGKAGTAASKFFAETLNGDRRDAEINKAWAKRQLARIPQDKDLLPGGMKEYQARQAAADALYQWTLERISERYGGVGAEINRALTAPEKGGLPSGAGDSEAGARGKGGKGGNGSGDKKDKVGAAGLSNLEAHRLTVGKEARASRLTEIRDLEELTEGWDVSGLGSGLLDNPLAWKPRKPSFSLTGAPSSTSFGDLGSADKSDRTPDLTGLAFAADRSSFLGDDTQAHLSRLKIEEEAYIQSWANTADSFEVQEQRKLDIQNLYDQKRMAIIVDGSQNRLKFEQASGQQQLSMIASAGAQMTSSVANSNKGMFLANKAFRLFEGGMELKAGIVKTFNSWPYPYNVGMAALHGVVGGMQLYDLASSSYGGSGGSPGGSYSGGSPGGSYGGGTIPSQIVAQPDYSSQQQRNITIEVKIGNVYGHQDQLKEWVVEQLAPVMRDASTRNITFTDE